MGEGREQGGVVAKQPALIGSACFVGTSGKLCKASAPPSFFVGRLRLGDGFQAFGLEDAFCPMKVCADVALPRLPPCPPASSRVESSRRRVYKGVPYGSGEEVDRGRRRRREGRWKGEKEPEDRAGVRAFVDEQHAVPD